MRVLLNDDPTPSHSQQIALVTWQLSTRTHACIHPPHRYSTITPLLPVGNFMPPNIPSQRVSSSHTVPKPVSLYTHAPAVQKSLNWISCWPQFGYSCWICFTIPSNLLSLRPPYCRPTYLHGISNLIPSIVTTSQQFYQLNVHNNL